MNVVIIGNGIAGITTATELRKRDKKINITLISGETDYFFSRPALMYIYMRDMKLKDTQPYEKKFWKKNKINLVKDWVTQVDFTNKKVTLQDQAPIEYDKLVLATGSKGNKFGWPGQDLPGVQTFVTIQDLEKIEAHTSNMNSSNKVVIVGGGLIGIEVAEMMHKRNIPTTFIVRDETYWNIALGPKEGQMVEEEIIDHHIDLKMKTELKQINAGNDGRVTSVETGDGEVIPCQLVVLTAGVCPNIDFLKDTKLDVARGIKVNQKLETNLPDVYACGDCAEFAPTTEGGRSLIEALWYTGKMHGKVLAENILGGSVEHDRGIWYNSAKFFNIDYHTYGLVGHNIEGEKELYFRIPGERKSIRIIYLADRVIGFNVLGIRYRDAVCRKWIDEKRSLEYVIENLHEANFDGEFYKRYEKDFKNAFTEGRI